MVKVFLFVLSAVLLSQPAPRSAPKPAPKPAVKPAKASTKPASQPTEKAVEKAAEKPLAEKLVLLKLNAIAFKAPAGWDAKLREGVVQMKDGEIQVMEAAAQRKAGQLKGAEARFDIRGGDAFIEVWVAELNPFESPRDCLGEMIQKVELKGWKHILIDGYPAARWIGTRAGGEEGIPLAEEEGNKVLDTRVTEIFLMGCNGARKWVLKMSAKTQDAAKHGPTFRRVRESIEYCAHMSLDSRTSKPKPNCQ